MATSESIAERTVPCPQVKENQPIVLSFAPIPDSQNQQYRIVIRSDDSAPGNAITVWAKSNLHYTEGTLSYGGDLLAGGLWFDFDYERPDGFEVVAQTDTYSIYHFKGSLSRYFSVGNGIAAKTNAQMWEMISDTSFNPSQDVILNLEQADTAPLASGDEYAAVQALTEQPTSITLHVSRSTPGYLVLAKTFYPGWKAIVNGVAQPVLRANYAFSAVRLNAGESEVVYYYDPDSLRYGLLITASSMAVSVLLVAVWLIRRNRKSTLDRTDMVQTQ